MKVLVIEPVEPLSLSSTPITGVKIFSTIDPLPTPLPTTVIGAIGASLNIKLSSNDPIEGIEELINKVKDRLRCREPIILGPLTQFKIKNTYSEPTILISDKNLFVTPDIVKGHELLIDECRPTKCFEFNPIIAIGTALERGSVGDEKRIRLGYMYRYPLLTYKTFNDSEVVEPRFIYILNCDEGINGIIRFGGEDRIARIYAIEGDEVGKHVKNIANPLSISMSGLYITLSPVPLIPTPNNIASLYIDSVLGLEFIDGVGGVIGIPQKGKLPKIIVERLGLGYYEVSNIRRPQILVLPLGTLINIKDTKKVNSNKLLSMLYSIGFASLYLLT
jgi:hypothetical protein